MIRKVTTTALFMAVALTGEIFVNSRFLAIAASPDGNIEYQWFPLCVVRTHTAENLARCLLGRNIRVENCRRY